MDNLEIYNRYRAVPQEAQKKITGGRINGFTDINSMWRIKCLTEQFGPCGIGWYIEVIDKRIEVYNDEIAVFVDINLYVKADGEWSKPIFGNGGSKFVTKERSGAYVSDECFKMAVTDAISVACKMLGIGADIYWAEDRTKYETRSESKPAAVKPAESKQPKEAQTIGDMEPKYYNSLAAELKRTGVGQNSVKDNYKVKDLKDLTFAQYQDAMNKFKGKPDKEVAQAALPINPPEDEYDDGDLPWNQSTPLEKADANRAKKKTKHEQANELYDELLEKEKFT